MPFYVDSSEFDPAGRPLISEMLEKYGHELHGPHYTSDFIELVNSKLREDELVVLRDDMLAVIRQAVSLGLIRVSKRGSATMYTWVGP